MAGTDGSTLFRNVRVFDSRNGGLTDPAHVLVRGSTIETVTPVQEALPEDETETETDAATVIDGDGRTLMPGLIDAHWHAMMAAAPLAALLTADFSYLALVAGSTASETLMRGFTTVRDMGGPAFGLKQAIDSASMPSCSRCPVRAIRIQGCWV